MAVEVKHPSAGLGAFVRGVLERRRQRRRAAAIYELLCGLDGRTLRDIGIHREEIWSVAAEIAGQAERTRRISTSSVPARRTGLGPSGENLHQGAS